MASYSSPPYLATDTRLHRFDTSPRAHKPRMAPNPVDFEAVRNTIALYCIALDTKKFELLKDVFVLEPEAKYPFGGAFGDRQALADAIEKRLAPVTTQHALTTQHISIADDGKSANVTTYFTGVHLGKGRWKDQLVTAYGIYTDKLECFSDENASIKIPGASGEWLISRRAVAFIGRVGEEGVMKGENAESS